MKRNLLFRYLFTGIFFILSLGVSAQQTITGNVTDGVAPLPGVSVVVKGTNVGVVTDFDGNFSLITEESFPINNDT